MAINDNIKEGVDCMNNATTVQVEKNRLYE